LEQAKLNPGLKKLMGQAKGKSAYEKSGLKVFILLRYYSKDISENHKGSSFGWLVKAS